MKCQYHRCSPIHAITISPNGNFLNTVLDQLTESPEHKVWYCAKQTINMVNNKASYMGKNTGVNNPIGSLIIFEPFTACPNFWDSSHYYTFSLPNMEIESLATDSYIIRKTKFVVYNTVRTLVFDRSKVTSTKNPFYFDPTNEMVEAVNHPVYSTDIDFPLIKVQENNIEALCGFVSEAEIDEYFQNLEILK